MAIHIFRVGESSLVGRLASLMGSFAVVTLIAAGRRKALTLGLATSHAVMPNYRKPDAWQDRAYTPLLEAESLTWSTPFDDAIDLPDGRKLITLRDAAAYVSTLPETEQQATKWKSAARSLIEAAKHRDLLVLAQIDMLKALNRHV